VGTFFRRYAACRGPRPFVRPISSVSIFVAASGTNPPIPRALAVAITTIARELLTLALLRWRFFHTGFLRSFASVASAAQSSPPSAQHSEQAANPLTCDSNDPPRQGTPAADRRRPQTGRAATSPACASRPRPPTASTCTDPAASNNWAIGPRANVLLWASRVGVAYVDASRREAAARAVPAGSVEARAVAIVTAPDASRQSWDASASTSERPASVAVRRKKASNWAA
jgi:hypothetical protein